MDSYKNRREKGTVPNWEQVPKRENKRDLNLDLMKSHEIKGSEGVER